MRLENRVAIITGAGRGIGQAIALAYAKEGGRVALAARTLSELQETASQAESLGAATCVIPTDISDQVQVDEMVRQTLDRFSTVDILVNSAGVPGPVGALQDNDVSYWIRTIQVNLIGTFLCCRAALPAMLRQDRGKIINFSGAGGRALRHMSAYVSTKAAIERLTEALSLELAGKNVKVNVMGPGAHRTRMVEELLESATASNDTQSIEHGQQVLSREDSLERAAELAVILASEPSGNLSSRLISSVKDDFPSLAPRIPDIMASDAYTLRRVELE